MKRYKKRIIWVIIILAVIAGVFFLFKDRKPKTSYTLEEAKRMDLIQTVSVTGTVRPEIQISLAFKGSGIVEKMDVDVGDRVEKGQLLAKIDIDILASELKQAQEDIEYQDETLGHMKDNKGTYDKEQRDAQRALVRKYQAGLQSAKTKIYYKYLYAPVSGIIIRRNVDVGEVAIATDEVLAVTDGELEIEANVPESDIVKVKLDQNAEIVFDAFSVEEKFKARVIEIEPASTVIQDVVYYKVKLRLSNIDPRLKVGMSCDVDIRTSEKNNVIAVPLRAVKTEGGKKYVEILKDERNNITEKIHVSTGLEGDDGMVEITSGLKGGEKVITLTSTK